MSDTKISRTNVDKKTDDEIKAWYEKEYLDDISSIPNITEEIKDWAKEGIIKEGIENTRGIYQLQICKK